MPWSKFQLFVSISSPCLPQCHDLKSNSLFKLPPPCLPQCHDLNSNFYLNFPPCLPQYHDLKSNSLAFHTTAPRQSVRGPWGRYLKGGAWEIEFEGPLRKASKPPLRCLRSLRSSLKVPSKASAKASTLEATLRYLEEAWRLWRSLKGASKNSSKPA